MSHTKFFGVRSVADLFAQSTAFFIDRWWRWTNLTPGGSTSPDEAFGRSALLAVVTSAETDPLSNMYVLADYAPEAPINLADLMRQCGAQVTSYIAFERNAGDVTTAEDMIDAYLDGYCPGFVDFIEAATDATVEIIKLSNDQAGLPDSRQGTLALFLSNDNMTAVINFTMTVHVWDKTLDDGVQQCPPVGVSSALPIGGAVTLADVAQSLSDIAHTRMDFQMNNGGPSWSLSGGARIDGPGGGG